MVRKIDNIYRFGCVDPDTCPNINLNFIKVIGRVPEGGLFTPFDEIKKYLSWTWGSDAASRPQFNLEQQPVNAVCDTCANSSLCDSTNANVGIKVKITNSYKLLVNTSEFQNELTEPGTDNAVHATVTGPSLPTPTHLYSRPFKDYTNRISNVSIFAVQHYTDPNEHPVFSEYKPLGDVIFLNTEIDYNSTDISKCRPNDGDTEYDGPLFTPVIGKDNKSSPNPPNNINDLYNSNHVYTIMVSGDTKPPIDYHLDQRIHNKGSGVNQNYETITIWRPVAPEGYVACGYVVDMRPYDGDGTIPPPPKPSRDRIVTIPISALNDLKINIGSNRYSNLPNLPNTQLKRNKFNLFIDDQHQITSSDSQTNHICTQNTELDISRTTDPVFRAHIDRIHSPNTLQNPSANHDKRYSIMKVYEEDNFD